MYSVHFISTILIFNISIESCRLRWNIYSSAFADSSTNVMNKHYKYTDYIALLRTVIFNTWAFQ